MRISLRSAILPARCLPILFLHQRWTPYLTSICSPGWGASVGGYQTFSAAMGNANGRARSTEQCARRDDQALMLLPDPLNTT